MNGRADLFWLGSAWLLIFRGSSELGARRSELPHVGVIPIHLRAFAGEDKVDGKMN